jgi:nicotinate-nucleotide pyrophosphorylase (carboxylating)
MHIPELTLKSIIETAIQEDIQGGDLTSTLTLDKTSKSKGQIIAKQIGIISGIYLIEFILKNYTSLDYTLIKKDGELVSSKDVILSLEGNTIEILSYERLMLNFLQHLSGIATITYQFSKIVEPYGSRVLDTRKTIPGLRLLEKQAVSHGEGTNHRIGLYDAVLIKENHIKAAGSITNAVTKIIKSNQYPKLKSAPSFFIEVETETLEEVKEACNVNVDYILLDNMPLPLLKKCVDYIKMNAPHIKSEASGNVSINTIEDIAKQGPDRISIGSITHSAPAMDFSLLLN